MKHKSFLGNLTGRVVVGRLLGGTDLFEGIEELCDQYNIRYGFLLCHGSLLKAGMEIITGKLGEVREYEKESTGQVICAIGTICERENGERDLHIHACLNDELCHFYGGHLIKGRCPVFSTLDVIIIEIKGGKMLRKYDKETGRIEFSPEPNSY